MKRVDVESAATGLRIVRSRLGGLPRRYEPVLVGLIVAVAVTRVGGGAFVGIGDGADRSRVAIAPFVASAADPDQTRTLPEAEPNFRFVSPTIATEPTSIFRPDPSVGHPPATDPVAGPELSTFATVPKPGAPTAIAVDRSGDVWVATDNGSGRGDPGVAVLFRFSPNGVLRATHPMEAVASGITAIHVTSAGVLYLASRNPAALSRFDPESGKTMTLATVPDVPPCVPLDVVMPCDGHLTDEEPVPSSLAFDRAGNAFVSDVGQAAVWRVPLGGGDAEQWIVDRAWASPTSPSGPSALAFDGKGNMVIVVRSTLTANSGVVYLQQVGREGEPGPRTELARTGDGSNPAGLALSNNGRAYVTLQGSGKVLVLAPDGKEMARLPADVGIDTPAGIAFVGQSVLIASQAPADPAGGKILRLRVGESGPLG